MEEAATHTIIPAQPRFFKLLPYRDERGSVAFRKDAIIAWCITIERDGLKSETSAHAVTTDIFGEPIGEFVCILRPDGMVEETDRAIVSLAEWLSDPELLKRHP